MSVMIHVFLIHVSYDSCQLWFMSVRFMSVWFMSVMIHVSYDSCQFDSCQLWFMSVMIHVSYDSCQFDSWFMSVWFRCPQKINFVHHRKVQELHKHRFSWTLLHQDVIYNNIIIDVATALIFFCSGAINRYLIWFDVSYDSCQFDSCQFDSCQLWFMSVMILVYKHTSIQWKIHAICKSEKN